MLLNRLYYQFKPWLPWRLRLAGRRLWAAGQRQRSAGQWPIAQSAGTPPEGWPGWPHQKQFAVVLTHDVEGQVGLDRCRNLVRLETELGFRSSFNFIPEGSYSVSKTLRDELAASGFEIGVHDLRHDGKLFRTRNGFRAHAARINSYLREWGAVGFRSGFMLRNLDWIRDLEIEYDASTFDTDPFEPQPEGAGTIFPFRVGGSHGRDYVELPYTLPQDSTLFIYLQERDNSIWREKLDWIAAHGGVALLNTHPDYMSFDAASATGSREYPARHYRQFLEYLRTRYAGQYWLALPREAARHVREHAAVPAVSRKRICMVAYSFYESDNRVMRYAEALASRGDSVEVLALQSRPGQPRQEQIGQVTVHRIQKRLEKNERSKIVYLLRLLRFCFRASFSLAWRHFAKPYDVIHVHNIPDFLVFAAWFPKWTGARVVLDIHDIVPEFYASKFAEASSSRWFRWLVAVERWSARFADHVIISNHLWHQKLLGRSVTPENSSVFINHVDLNVFAPARRSRTDEKIRFIFPGGLQWHQGLDIAIEAIALLRPELPDAEFHIYGQGGARRDLVALTQRLGLQERVLFFDSVPLTSVAGVIANADIGIVPKRADSFGNEAYSTKILEFMSQGVPVVASRTAIDSYYFNDDCVLFFESGNVRDLADKLLVIVRDSALRARLVAHARDYVALHNWQNKREDYLRLMDVLCESGESPLVSADLALAK